MITYSKEPPEMPRQPQMHVHDGTLTLGSLGFTVECLDLLHRKLLGSLSRDSIGGHFSNDAEPNTMILDSCSFGV